MISCDMRERFHSWIIRWHQSAKFWSRILLRWPQIPFHSIEVILKREKHTAALLATN